MEVRKFNGIISGRAESNRSANIYVCTSILLLLEKVKFPSEI